LVEVLKDQIVFIAYYPKSNIFSFNAIIAAAESIRELEDFPIYLARSIERLFNIIRSKLVKDNTVLVGISFFTTQIWSTYHLITLLRNEFDKKVTIIAGGPHPTGDPIGTLNMGFDLVVIGEGEATFIDILKKAKEGNILENIEGTCYKNSNNEVRLTERLDLVDLDLYPALPVKHNLFGSIEITRGCPFACNFCQNSYMFGMNPRHRSIESICETITIMKRVNKTDIRFITPNAFSYGSIDGKTLNLMKLENLLKEITKIIKPNGRIFLGSFPSEVRPEHVNFETLSLVKKYGSNDNIVIGAQSGSQRMLNLCNRSHKVEDVYVAVELARKFNLNVYVDFIFGLPYETDEDFESTMAVIKDFSKMGAVSHAHSFIPLPNTPFSNFRIKPFKKEMRKRLEQLHSRGIVFGDWKNQEQQSIKIAKYFQNKILD
jgi:B12-binding domain/radical SAM domain protein